MNPNKLRARIAAPDYHEQRYLAMEKEAQAFWTDWQIFRNPEDFRQYRRYLLKANHHLQKMHL